MWDRDTLATEAAGAPDLTLLIAGKVDRFPKKYYEVREKRLVEVAEISDPLVFDDLAICILKIRADTECWPVHVVRKLEDKEKLVARLVNDGKLTAADAQSHLYRSNVSVGLAYLLNCFEWVPFNGDFPKSVSLPRLKEAANIKSLAPGDRCLKLFVDWLIKAEAPGDSLLPDFLDLRHANKTALEPNNQLKDRGLEDCIEGLTGLIRAAPEFECVDVFYALSLALAVNGQQSLAHMARLRAYEIIEAGGKSLVLGAPTGEQLKLQITPRRPEGGQMVDTIPLSKEMRASIEADYKKLRARVIARERDRVEFMTARLNKGEHPDTHPDFWKGWIEPDLKLPAAAPTEPVKEPAPPQPRKEVIYAGIPAPNTPGEGRVAIGGLQVHWIGLVVAGALVVMVGLALALAAMRKRGHD